MHVSPHTAAASSLRAQRVSDAGNRQWKQTFHRTLSAVLAGLLCSCATVAPPPPRNVRIDPDPVDFGKVFVGDVENHAAVVENNTAARLNVAASSVTAGTPFTPGVATPALPVDVPPHGGALPFRFDFKPTDVGSFTAKWTVKIDGTDYALDLVGRGVGVVRSTPGIGFNSSDAGISETGGIDFRTLVVGQRRKGRLEVVHSGTDLVVGIPPQITEQPGNPRAGAFLLVKPTAPPASLTLVDPLTMRQLAPNERRSIGVEVEFRPRAAGTYKATLTIADANGTTVMRILLKGVATARADGESGD